jgi:hypothetical protein
MERASQRSWYVSNLSVTIDANFYLFNIFSVTFISVMKRDRTFVMRLWPIGKPMALL